MVRTIPMGEAYDMARKELHDRGQPIIVQEVLAGRIIALVKSGQRDPAKMVGPLSAGLFLRYWPDSTLGGRF